MHDPEYIRMCSSILRYFIFCSQEIRTHLQGKSERDSSSCCNPEVFGNNLGHSKTMKKVVQGQYYHGCISRLLVVIVTTKQGRYICAIKE